MDEHGAVAGLLLEVNVEGLVLLGEGEHLGAVEGRDVVADDLDSFLAKVLVVDTEVAGGRTEVDELGQRAWERERGGGCGGERDLVPHVSFFVLFFSRPNPRVAQ